jgi:cell division transport system ATP-binding protein
VIRLEAVDKKYMNGNVALDGVSMHLNQGEMAFLTGPSGSGKSTLLRLLMAADRPTAGEIRVLDEDPARLRPRQIPRLRRRMGVVFQDHRLVAHRTVFDNVALPLRVLDLPETAVAERVQAALSRLGLKGLADCLPETLSGGEQQRVGIARAVVTSPEVIIADEPTGNLDPELSFEVMRLFDSFRKAGATVLVATHDLVLVGRMPHPVYHLDAGQLEATHV